MWIRMLLSLSLTTILVGLCAGAAAAQCATDDDCESGEVCNSGLELVECAVPPCPDPDAGGQCQPEQLGAACQLDDDCGEGLQCSRLEVASLCPQGAEDCQPERSAEGFCAREGDDVHLAATSGLAPDGATGSVAALDGADASASDDSAVAGGAGPVPAAEAAASNGRGASGGGCSVAAVGGTSLSTVAWLSLAMVLLRGRGGRRSPS